MDFFKKVHFVSARIISSLERKEKCGYGIVEKTVLLRETAFFKRGCSSRVKYTVENCHDSPKRSQEHLLCSRVCVA